MKPDCDCDSKRALIYSLIQIALFCFGLICGLIVIRIVFNYNAMNRDVGAWGVFFTLFGVLYAVVIGFLIIQVIEKFNELSGLIEEELNTLEDIRDLFFCFEDTNSSMLKEIIRSLYEYVLYLLNVEWHMMSDKIDMDSDTCQEIYNIMVNVNKIALSSRKDEILFHHLIDRVMFLTSIRTKRIARLETRIPYRLNILINFMSVVLVLGFVLLAVSNIWIHCIMLMSVIISVTIIRGLITDLDNPFIGIWNIDKTQIISLSTNLEKMCKSQSLFMKRS